MLHLRSYILCLLFSDWNIRITTSNRYYDSIMI